MTKATYVADRCRRGDFSGCWGWRRDSSSRVDPGQNFHKLVLQHGVGSNLALVTLGEFIESNYCWSCTIFNNCRNKKKLSEIKKITRNPETRCDHYQAVTSKKEFFSSFLLLIRRLSLATELTCRPVAGAVTVLNFSNWRWNRKSTRRLVALPEACPNLSNAWLMTMSSGTVCSKSLNSRFGAAVWWGIDVWLSLSLLSAWNPALFRSWIVVSKWLLSGHLRIT